MGKVCQKNHSFCGNQGTHLNSQNSFSKKFCSGFLNITAFVLLFSHLNPVFHILIPMISFPKSYQRPSLEGPSHWGHLTLHLNKFHHQLTDAYISAFPKQLDLLLFPSFSKLQGSIQVQNCKFAQ